MGVNIVVAHSNGKLENKALMKIFGHRKEEITGGWRKSA
jgi:hypothetical protein